MNYNEFMEYYQFPKANMNIQNNSNDILDTPEEGFLKGNMFKNTYNQYKNYSYSKLNPTDEKSRLLMDISKYSFAAHDLNLYLDLNPNDDSMLMLFNDYRNKANGLINEYESKFGPISVSEYNDTQTPFDWSEKNFPWERGGRFV